MKNKKLLIAITKLCDDLKENYITEYPTLAGSKSVYFLIGRKYCKIVECTLERGPGSGQMRVWGFVNMVEGKFIIGDVLMAASFNAPATNKARGNLLDGYSVTSSNMYGPGYL